MNKGLPWRYRLYKRMPRFICRIWGYDWAEDDRLTGEQVRRIFYSLSPLKTGGPPVLWIQPPNMTTGTGTSFNFYYFGGYR